MNVFSVRTLVITKGRAILDLLKREKEMSAENRKIAERIWDGKQPVVISSDPLIAHDYWIAMRVEVIRDIERALDDAEKRGATWMREKAAMALDEKVRHDHTSGECPYCEMPKVYAKAISALPTDKESENV